MGGERAEEGKEVEGGAELLPLAMHIDGYLNIQGGIHNSNTGTATMG